MTHKMGRRPLRKYRKIQYREIVKPLIPRYMKKVVRKMASGNPNYPVEETLRKDMMLRLLTHVWFRWDRKLDHYKEMTANPKCTDVEKKKWRKKMETMQYAIEELHEVRSDVSEGRDIRPPPE